LLLAHGRKPRLDSAVTRIRGKISNAPDAGRYGGGIAIGPAFTWDGKAIPEKRGNELKIRKNRGEAVV
jgi:hypothetical protein